MSLTPEVIAAAQAAQRKYGVWASVSLAQFGVESSWGRAMPPGSNNPFGIKATSGQASVPCRTREVIGGQSVYVIADFAKYANFDEAFEAHAKLLSSHPQYYGEAMKYAYGKPGGNAEDFIRGLKRYATDPNYIPTLISTARSNNLYQYDSIAASPSVPVQVPTSVPQPVASWLIYLLNNVFSGTVSTLVGLLSLAYAFVVYHHIPVSNLPLNSDWKPWVAFGLALVFGMGAVPTTGSPPVQVQPPVQPQENIMDPTLLPKLVAVFEALLPLLQKALADAPAIRADIEQMKPTLSTLAADIEQLKAGSVATASASAPVASKLDEFLNTLNQISQTH